MRSEDNDKLALINMTLKLLKPISTWGHHIHQFLITDASHVHNQTVVQGINAEIQKRSMLQSHSLTSVFTFDRPTLPIQIRPIQIFKSPDLL